MKVTVFRMEDKKRHGAFYGSSGYNSTYHTFKNGFPTCNGFNIPLSKVNILPYEQCVFGCQTACSMFNWFYKDIPVLSDCGLSLVGYTIDDKDIAHVYDKHSYEYNDRYPTPYEQITFRPNEEGRRVLINF